MDFEFTYVRVEVKQDKKEIQMIKDTTVFSPVFKLPISQTNAFFFFAEIFFLVLIFSKMMIFKHKIKDKILFKYTYLSISSITVILFI